MSEIPSNPEGQTSPAMPPEQGATESKVPDRVGVYSGDLDGELVSSAGHEAKRRRIRMGLVSSIRNLLGSKEREATVSGTSFEGAEGVELARNVSSWSLGHRDVAAFGPNYFAGRDGSLGIRLRSNPFDDHDSATRES